MAYRSLVVAAVGVLALGAHVVAALSPFDSAGAQSSPVRWGAAVLEQSAQWYASAEARAAADNVLRYQSPHGAWPKNTDLASPPASAEALAAAHGGPDANTIDNDATTRPIRFLALMTAATGDARYRVSVERGLDYLLAAQYENGGWPQYYPLREGYYSRITFNDHAMVNVMTVLRDLRDAAAPFDVVDEQRRARAAQAVDRGVLLILRTQVRQDGRLTAWCAQHDERTLEPAWARNYEPPTLSGNETVGIVRVLMSIEQPSLEIIAAVEAAVAWLRSVAIDGLRLEEFTNADGARDRRVVVDPAAPPLWARFYDLRTNRPVFTGRDRVIRGALDEIEHERRSGYAYYGTWPARLLDDEYPRWRARRAAATSPG